jgi:hypothetical protein
MIPFILVRWNIAGLLFFPGDLPMPPKVADSMGSGRRVERQGGRWRWRTANGARLNGAGDFWNLPSGYG